MVLHGLFLLHLSFLSHLDGLWCQPPSTILINLWNNLLHLLVVCSATLLNQGRIFPLPPAKMSLHHPAEPLLIHMLWQLPIVWLIFYPYSSLLSRLTYFVLCYDCKFWEQVIYLIFIHTTFMWPQLRSTFLKSYRWETSETLLTQKPRCYFNLIINDFQEEIVKLWLLLLFQLGKFKRIVDPWNIKWKIEWFSLQMIMWRNNFKSDDAPVWTSQILFQNEIKPAGQRILVLK